MHHDYLYISPGSAVFHFLCNLSVIFKKLETGSTVYKSLASVYLFTYLFVVYIILRDDFCMHEPVSLPIRICSCGTRFHNLRVKKFNVSSCISVNEWVKSTFTCK